MRKKDIREKGFTLIELLAVLIILAAIATIVFPAVQDALKDSTQKAYDIAVSSIESAAKSYLYMNSSKYKDDFSQSGYITIDVQLLKDEGFLRNEVKNPKDKTNMNGYVLITYVSTNKYTYEYKEGTKPYIGPDLVEGLIPVYYDEADMLWKKADKFNSGGQWYDYNNYKWANAVTVTVTNRTTYMNAAAGTTIPMTDINTMFVWIPRYKYRIPAGSGPREIDIAFEKKTEKSSGNAISTYYTHPAFTFGTTELSGIWVGKFEITGNITAITIVPDLTSITLETNKAFYDAIRTMQSNSLYGFNNDSNIHMIKNTEWGVAAYLSHSKYGKYGNSNYTDVNKEIYLNNSSSFITGRSMGAVGGNGIHTPTNEYIVGGYYTYDGKCASIHANLPAPCNSGSVGQVLTDKTLAYGASTTGTIYGIYGMSGGAWDSVMSVYMPNPIPSTGITDQSGFSTTTTNSQYENLLSIDSKYYDRYLGLSLSTYYIKGDATYETNGWYSDAATFSSNSFPWLYRGQRYNETSAGIFAYYIHNGTNNSYRSTRVVLVSE